VLRERERERDKKRERDRGRDRDRDRDIDRDTAEIETVKERDILSMKRVHKSFFKCFVTAKKMSERKIKFVHLFVCVYLFVCGCVCACIDTV
jgi:hypothetical protein